MSYTKASIFNLTLSKLLLTRQIEETETDTSNECRVLNQFWDTALSATLQDLDLDSTSSEIKLELLEEMEEGPYSYRYKYPSEAAVFRRIVSGCITDNRSSHISKSIKMVGTQKCIFTDQPDAYAEIIAKDLPLDSLNPMAAIALATKLALLSSPLITGKGAGELQERLRQEYIIAKAEAQEVDHRENMNYEEDSLRSEFVHARLT